MSDTQEVTQFVPTPNLPKAEDDSSASVDPIFVVMAHPKQEVLGSRFFPFQGVENFVGRSPETQIFVGNVPSVSRLHAVIEWDGRGVQLRDLGSTNGTYVNDQRITEAVVLQDGDCVQFGSVHMKFLQRPDIERAYHEAMYELASTDGLTGLANRRRFDEELPRELIRADRYERPLSLMLIDLDEFKAINDSRGHVAGDAVLKHVATVCRRVTRKEQLVARIGGDELAILCPETPAEKARCLAERIRRSLSESPLSWEGSWIFVTLSIGIAEFDPAELEPDLLYAAADRALYRAKDAGRDRVCL